MYLVKKVSEMSGVSVRTLHHYDEIGLLSPQKAENGYRYYSEEDMTRLQSILFYKYLGFSLKDIKQMIEQKDRDILSHLQRQLNLMQAENAKLLTLIETLEKTILSQERKLTMTTQEKFKGFTYADNQTYKQAAMDRYGKEVIERALEKQKGKEEEVTAGFNTIFFAFAENKNKGKNAGDSENTKLAKELQEHICKYSFDCSLEVFSGIGYSYVQNEEFKQNLDKFGDGFAQYVCDAIQQYVKGNGK